MKVVPLHSGKKYMLALPATGRFTRKTNKKQIVSLLFPLQGNNSGRTAMGYLLPWQRNCVASYTTGLPLPDLRYDKNKNSNYKNDHKKAGIETRAENVAHDFTARKREHHQ